LRATMLLMIRAGRPLRWPSASTREMPPCGRSIISNVSPLMLVAYLGTLATPTSISRGMAPGGEPANVVTADPVRPARRRLRRILPLSAPYA